jgi:hypothetical protein
MRSRKIPLNRIVIIFFFAGLTVSCEPKDYHALDGSSDQSYHKSLQSVLKKIPEEFKDDAINVLEKKYYDFIRKDPIFAAKSKINPELRPPEYLASIDGLSADDLMLEAKALRKRQAEKEKLELQREKEEEASRLARKVISDKDNEIRAIKENIWKIENEIDSTKNNGLQNALYAKNLKFSLVRTQLVEYDSYFKGKLIIDFTVKNKNNMYNNTLSFMNSNVSK